MRKKQFVNFLMFPFLEWIVWLVKISVFYSRNFNKNILIGRRTRMTNVIVEESVFISNDCSVVNSKVGKFTYISSGGIISNTKIGNFCSIGPGVKIGVGMHPTHMVSTHPSFYSCQGNIPTPTFAKSQLYNELDSIYIGSDVFIGANSIILNGVRIEDGAVVAAGSVVTSDVGPYSIVGGVPSKHIKYRFEKDIIESLLKSKWWLGSKSYLQNNAIYFSSVEEFIKQSSISS